MIIVFGSNVLDLFFHQTDLPAKDTAVFLETHIEQPGGKGANQAVAVARAGSEVRFYGALGDGGHGRQMYKNLAQNNVDVSGVKFLDMPSGLATIFVDESDGTHKVVVSQGANLHARQDTIPDKFLNENTIVLLQGELPIKETEALIKRAKASGARTFMNLAPVVEIDKDVLRDLDLIVLNEHEANALGMQCGYATDDKEALAQKFYEDFDMVTVVTLGGRGALAYDENGLVRVSAMTVTPVDMLGAGDAFVGNLTAAIDQGKSLIEALRQASVAGALTCAKTGAQTGLPYADDIVMHIKNVDIEQKKAA